MDLTVDGNVFALFRGKSIPDVKLLNELSENIGLQYADAMQGAEYLAYTGVANQLLQTQALYDEIGIAIKTLAKWYNKKLADQLNSIMRTNYKFDVYNPEEYDRELKSAANRSKGIMLQIEMLEIQVSSMKEKFKIGGGKVTREYYYNWIFNLENHFKMRLGSEMTVYEFCSRIRMRNDEIEFHNNALKAQQNG